jgi:GNAT superfamily N-acetyltransferase
MTVTIREFRPTDAEAVSHVRSAVLPHMITTAELVGWQAATAPAAQRHRMFVAEDDGRLVGIASTGLIFESSEAGSAFGNLAVPTPHRGRGAGSALLAAAEEYLAGIGARTVYSWVSDDEGSTGFAERHGYRRGRTGTGRTWTAI